MSTGEEITLCLFVLFLGVFFGSLLFPGPSESCKTLTKIGNEISAQEYDAEKYNCNDFSKSFIKRMNEEGLYAEYVYMVNTDEENYHAVVRFYYEPQENRILGTEDMEKYKYFGNGDDIECFVLSEAYKEIVKRYVNLYVECK